jgi:hypothetical protein
MINTVSQPQVLRRVLGNVAAAAVAEPRRRDVTTVAPIGARWAAQRS